MSLRRLDYRCLTPNAFKRRGLPSIVHPCVSVEHTFDQCLFVNALFDVRLLILRMSGFS